MRFSLLRRRRSTAAVARERLQVLLAHERPLLARPDLLVTLREDIEIPNAFASALAFGS